jgi:hypothetical protein
MIRPAPLFSCLRLGAPWKRRHGEVAAFTRRPDGPALAKPFAFPKPDRTLVPAGGLSAGPGGTCARLVITFFTHHFSNHHDHHQPNL